MVAFAMWISIAFIMRTAVGHSQFLCEVYNQTDFSEKSTESLNELHGRIAFTKLPSQKSVSTHVWNAWVCTESQATKTKRGYAEKYLGDILYRTWNSIVFLEYVRSLKK